MTGDLHEAEEVVQEAFTRAAARWSRLRDYDVPEAWLRRVAMNLVTDRACTLRRHTRAMLKLRPPPRPSGFGRGACAGPSIAHPAGPAAPGAGAALSGRPAGRGGRPDAGHPTGTVKSLLSRGRHALAAKLGETEEVLDPHERPTGTTARAGHVAAFHGRTPGPEVAPRRADLRRLRLLGGTAMLVVLAVVAGMSPPTGPGPAHPTPPAPTASPTSTTIRPVRSSAPETDPFGHPPEGEGTSWAASRTRPRRHVRDVTSLVRGCRDRSLVRLWARAQGKVWLIAAKPPPPGRQHLCWATALMNQGGGAPWGPSLRGEPLRATFAGGGNRQLGVVSGMVTKRAVRLRFLSTRDPHSTWSRSTLATSSRSTSGWPVP